MNQAFLSIQAIQEQFEELQRREAEKEEQLRLEIELKNRTLADLKVPKTVPYHLK